VGLDSGGAFFRSATNGGPLQRCGVAASRPGPHCTAFPRIAGDDWNDATTAFFPSSRSENNAGCMLDALAPLRHLTRRGLSVLVLHHPGKGERPVGQLACGSGALSAAAVLLEMRFSPKAPEEDHRRWLQPLSRFPETPRQKVIELTADGTDYLSRGTFHEEEFAARWAVLLPILSAAGWKYTRLEVLRRWPGEQPPDKVSLARWLEKAVELGLLREDGRGHKSHPFRYWLAEREQPWREDPISALLMPELFQTAESAADPTGPTPVPPGSTP
jgi:hypothetical protein